MLGPDDRCGRDEEDLADESHEGEAALRTERSSLFGRSLAIVKSMRGDCHPILNRHGAAEEAAGSGRDPRRRLSPVLETRLRGDDARRDRQVGQRLPGNVYIYFGSKLEILLRDLRSLAAGTHPGARRGARSHTLAAQSAEASAGGALARHTGRRERLPQQHHAGHIGHRPERRLSIDARSVARGADRDAAHGLAPSRPAPSLAQGQIGARDHHGVRRIRDPSPPPSA